MGKLAQNAARPQPGPGAGLAGLMGGAARPPARPPARPAQGGGVEGMLMARNAQRPNAPVRMAQGGIVSFADGEEVSSPFGRWFRSTVDRVGEDMALQRLKQKVKTKYGVFASPAGALRTQSDAQRAYAKNVLAAADDLSEAQLIALADAEFDSGMTDLSALPAIPMSSPVTPPEDTVDAADPLATVESEAPEIDSGTGSVTFLPAEQEDFFRDVPTSYNPVVPKAADTARLDASITEMTDQAGEVPTMAEVAPLEAAPLEAVAAPYDEQGQAILRSLTARYAQDMSADPLSAMQAAGASSDAYFDRSGKAATYAQQEADERALQVGDAGPRSD